MNMKRLNDDLPDGGGGGVPEPPTKPTNP